MIDDRPQPDGSDRRFVEPADLQTLAATLARAFADNPGMSWTFRDPDTRPVKLERGFGDYLRHIWLPRGECWTTDRLDGAALWMPPAAGRCRGRCNCGCSPTCSPAPASRRRG